MIRISPLVLGLVVGCNGLDEVTIEHGRHIDLEIDPGLEPRGDLVGHMDSFLELVAHAWGVDLDGRRYTYHWYTGANYAGESGCPASSNGCAKHSGFIGAIAAPLDHELVHVVTAALSSPPSFFTEGAAVAFELPYSTLEYAPVGDGAIDAELLAASPIPGSDYLLAGAFTRFLIDRFGKPAYLDFYAALEHGDDYDDIAAIHETFFGEPFVATIALFDEQRRDCEFERFRFKLFECAAPKIAFEGDMATLHRDLSCSGDDAVGPFYLSTQVSTWATVTIYHAGLYELSVAADAIYTRITLGSCGGCESAAPISLLTISGPHRLSLEAGDYYLRLDGSITNDTLAAAQLRRIDE